MSFTESNTVEQMILDARRPNRAAAPRVDPARRPARLGGSLGGELRQPSWELRARPGTFRVSPAM